MSDRVQLIRDEVPDLTGKTVTRFEYVCGETEDQDYLIIDLDDQRDGEGRGIGPITLYASDPSVYRDLLDSERVDEIARYESQGMEYDQA